jgi:hypothetical protein
MSVGRRDLGGLELLQPPRPKRLAPAGAERTRIPSSHQGIQERFRERVHPPEGLRRWKDWSGEALGQCAESALYSIRWRSGQPERIAECFETVGVKPATLNPGQPACRGLGEVEPAVRRRPRSIWLVRLDDQRRIEGTRDELTGEGTVNLSDGFRARCRTRRQRAREQSKQVVRRRHEYVEVDGQVRHVVVRRRHAVTNGVGSLSRRLWRGLSARRGSGTRCDPQQEYQHATFHRVAHARCILHHAARRCRPNAVTTRRSREEAGRLGLRVKAAAPRGAPDENHRFVR